MQDRIRGEASRTTMICVDSYEQGVLNGRFYNYGQEDEGCSFRSLTQLLVGMEHILDSANYPQSFTAVRSFSPILEPKLESPVDGTLRKGKAATFVVKILFRQHTSWQGSITWLEEKSEQTFRSVLELILLMDSALMVGQYTDGKVKGVCG